MPPPPSRLLKQAQPKDLKDLKAIYALLHLVHHRNHNQHRRSKWWKELGMLRRGVLGLIRVLEDGKERGGQEERQVEQGEQGEQRMSFLAREIIPRCWVAFSAVVADNRYAPLGLMLLGTLARLGKVIGLERIGNGEEEMRGDDGAMVGVNAVDIDGELSHAGIGMGLSMEDIGVATRRGEVEVEGGALVEKHEKYVNVEEMAAVVETGAPIPPMKRKKKKKRDAIDDLFKGLV